MLSTVGEADRRLELGQRTNETGVVLSDLRISDRAAAGAVDRALARHAISPQASLHSEILPGGSSASVVDHQSSRPRIAAGVLLASLNGWLTFRLFDGLGRASGAIDEFQATHGPLEIDHGVVDHMTGPTEALMRLCDEVSAAAGFLYPFGSALVVVLLGLWLVAGLLVFIDRPRWFFATFGVVAVGVISAAASFGGYFATIVAILE